MSDKESAEDKVMSNEEIEEETKAKGQKRKKPVKKATPAKKKLKSEEPPVAENKPIETESEEEEDEKSPVALLDRSPEVTGTRIRKQVERLNINSPASVESPDRRKNELLPGKGAKLGTSPKILAQLQSVKQSEMVLLHRLLYKRQGTAHEIKKNIREFSGFPFTKDDKEFDARKHMLEKNTLNDLKFICQMVCLEKSGTKESIIERILEFCLCPNPSTKAVVKKVKKSKERKKKTKSTSKSKSDDEKTSPKKNIVSSESVEDSSSSSSEDGDESEKEASPAASLVKNIKKKAANTPKASKEATTPKANKEAITSKASKEAVVTKKDTAKSKKKTPKKSPKKAEIKIKLPPVNKTKKKLVPIENNELEEEEDKNDSLINTSTDDEKLVRESENSPKKSPSANDEKPVQKSPSPAKKSTKSTTEPTNDELVDTIKEILKDANLEDMTMKNLCRQVYDKFPDFELEKTRKDFIRSTAREILGGAD